MLLGLVALVGGSLAVGGGTSSTTTTTRAPASTSTSAATTTTIDPAKLSPEAKELEAFAAKSRGGTYHVHFQVSGDGLGKDVTAATVDVWRDGARLRQDTSQTTTTGVSTSQIYSDASGVVQCLTAPGSAVTCQRVSAQPDAADDIVTGVEAIVNTGSSVSAKDDTVLDAPARCFDIAAGIPDSAGSVCFTPTGTPVRLVTPHFALSLVSVDAAVDDATFTPPAPATPTPSS